MQSEGRVASTSGSQLTCFTVVSVSPPKLTGRKGGGGGDFWHKFILSVLFRALPQ